MLVALALVALASGASAAPRDADAWLFGVAPEFGIYGHTGKGTARGGPITGFRAPPDLGSELTDLGDTIVESRSSREENSSILLGADFEVMTPGLGDGAGRPRFFLDVSIFEPLTNEVGLARDADPGPLRASPGGNRFGETAVLGRGSKLTVQQQGPQVHAGLGVAFELDLWDSEYIRIKPSFVYSRIPTDVYAVVHRPIRIGALDAPFDSRFRYFIQKEKFREVYHGVGPALEIEYDLQNRIGPIGVTLFIKGHASHLFGDLKTRLLLSQEVGGGAEPETATYKYSQDRWVYRGTTGVRLRWLPERLR